jgi:serine phosphatase RsbU (regulator of sigma subunit)
MSSRQTQCSGNFQPCNDGLNMRLWIGSAARARFGRHAVACTILAGLAVMGLFAVTQSGIAILAVTRFDDSFNQIANTNLPNFIAASHLSAASQALVGMAPAIVAADSQMRRQAMADRLSERLTALADAVDSIQRTTDDHDRVREVHAQLIALSISLRGLDDLAQLRIDANDTFMAVMARLPGLVTRVREIADNAIAEQQGNNPQTDAPADRRQFIAWSAAALEGVTLMLSAPSILTISRIDRVKPEFADLIKAMDRFRSGLPSSERSSIDSLQESIVQFGTGDTNIFEARRAQIENTIATETALQLIQQTSDKFTDSASGILHTTQEEIHYRSGYFQQMVSYFNVLIATTSMLCVVAGVAVFVYVLRAVIGRLGGVRDYMRARVEGRPASITTTGEDEIAEIAKTTHYFVTQIAAAREVEEAANRTIEAAYKAQAQLLQELGVRNEELGQSQAELRRQLSRVEAELIEAHDQQLSMVPSQFPHFFGGHLVEVHAAMRPAREVGGDFYDCFEVNSSTLCVAVGDVAGKGLPAALFMARARSLLRAVTLLLKDHLGRIPAPNEVVQVMNEELCKNNESCEFVTLFIGLLDATSGTLYYVNAGHVRPYVLPENADPFEYISPSDVPVGFEPEATFRVGTLPLARDDALLVISDGVHDMESKAGVAFGRGGTLQCLSQAPDRRAEPLVSHVLDALSAHGRGAEQTDDITVLAVRLH